MSKSKAQIAKLDNTIKTQKEEARVTEQNLNDGEFCTHACNCVKITLSSCYWLSVCAIEIAALKEQNVQLQAATRSRLQASDMERQDEIEQLKMRLEAKEATIAKLESLAAAATGNPQSIKKKGGKLLRKKKKKKNGECEGSVLSGAGSGVGSSISGSLRSLK